MTNTLPDFANACSFDVSLLRCLSRIILSGLEPGSPQNLHDGIDRKPAEFVPEIPGGARSTVARSRFSARTMGVRVSMKILSFALCSCSSWRAKRANILVRLKHRNAQKITKLQPRSIVAIILGRDVRLLQDLCWKHAVGAPKL